MWINILISFRDYINQEIYSKTNSKEFVIVNRNYKNSLETF